MDQEAITTYCGLMEEIRRRTDVVLAFLENPANAVYKAAAIESAYLQLRKILELIALGSLVANKEVYSKAHADFSKHWNAAYILKDIGRINPNFYPRPIIETPSSFRGVKMDWADRPEDYLSQKDYLKLYDKCGAILHADNPYGSQIDFGYYEQSINGWIEKITLLLNAHTIRLIGDPNIYLIHMLSEDDGRVKYTIFAPK